MSKLNQECKKQQNLTQKQEIINPLVKFKPIMDIKVSYKKFIWLHFLTQKTHSYLLILIFF